MPRARCADGDRQKAQRGATQGIHWTPTPAQVTAAMDWLKQRAEEQMLKWDLSPSRAVRGGVLMVGDSTDSFVALFVLY